MIIQALAVITLCFLLVALLNIAGWPKVRSLAVEDELSGPGAISILIPARNEEANLPSCLDAAIRQGPAVREILVYDDHSVDGTPAVIANYARLDARVRAVSPLPLEPGWCGKNFACYQLARAASGEWLLFIDADARLMEDAAARIVLEMKRRRLDLLSCWPGLEMIGGWERALMPVLNFVVFSIFPAPFSLHFPWPSLAIAHGACLAFSRASYFEIGGHAAVRDQIFEDVRLAQLWREKNARGLCLDGQEVVRVRMYISFEEIWRGFQKNFFPAFRHEISFWLFMLFHFSVFLGPVLLAMAAPTKWALIALANILALRLLLARYFRHPLWSALIHPVSEVILLLLGLSSWWRCKSGRGVTWKGREYHKAA